LFEIFKARKDPLGKSIVRERTLKLLNSTKSLTLKDCFYGYKILREFFPRKWLTYILEAQNPDGGFGFFKGTTSYMENSFFAYFVLKGFNLKPKSFQKLIEFVTLCKNKDGGFGRNPQGISFLSTTYYACWILKYA
jgi:hypothetical protein